MARETIRRSSSIKFGVFDDVSESAHVDGLHGGIERRGGGHQK